MVVRGGRSRVGGDSEGMCGSEVVGVDERE